MEIKFKKLSPEAKMPTRESDNAVGFDLYVARDTVVMNGRSVLPTDIAIELPVGYGADVRPRSGFSLKGIEGVATNAFLRWLFRLIGKTRFRLADVKLGTIDPDYRGGMGVIIRNDGVPFIVQRGTRIAQLVITKHETDVVFTECDELSNTERGSGGFGHTGA